MPFDQETAERLRASADPYEQRLGEAIPAILANTERKSRDEYGVMLLTRANEQTEGTLDMVPVIHVGRGAWTQSQRYTASELWLAGPSDTAALSRWEKERGVR